MGDEREREKGRGLGFPGENGKWSRLRLPACVLQMTLKSSCSQTASLLLAFLSLCLARSLRGNSEERVCGGSVPAVCSSAGERGACQARRRESRQRLPAGLFPRLPSGPSWLWAVALPLNLASRGSAVIGCFVPILNTSATLTPASPSVGQGLPIGTCLFSWA